VLDRCKIQPGQLDVFDGSPPCQGFSTAGKRNMKDPRNGLFREYCRLLEGLKPRAFVMENVSGMVKGKMKLVFVDVLKALKACGYLVSARLLNTMYFGVPQSRARMIFIGVRSDVGIEPSHPPAISVPVTLRDAMVLSCRDLPARKLTALAESRWNQTRRGDSHYQRFGQLRLHWNRVAPTILKASGSGGHYHPDEPRRLSIGELKRIASFPDDFKFLRTWDDAVDRIGNSVPPLFMRAIAEHVGRLLAQEVAA